MTVRARRYAQWCREHFEELPDEEAPQPLAEEIGATDEAPLPTAADGDVG